MGNIAYKRKRKFEDQLFMESRRNFGSPSGQVVARDPLTPDLFMKVGTRVGVITAYYRHVPHNSGLPPSVNSSTSVVRTPVVTKIPELETVKSMSEPVVYDVPKGTQ